MFLVKLKERRDFPCVQHMSIDAGNCRDAPQLKLIKPNLMPINIKLRIPANWKSQQTAFIRLDKKYLYPILKMIWSLQMSLLYSVSLKAERYCIKNNKRVNCF